jgi:hypothetical protein
MGEEFRPVAPIDPTNPPLPLEQMVRDSPVTPLDVPLHPRAAAVWQQHGFL